LLLQLRINLKIFCQFYLLIGRCNVSQELAQRARLSLIALLAFASVAALSTPAGAVPIARGLPALAAVLEEGSVLAPKPIALAGQDSNCDSGSGDSVALLPLRLIGLNASLDAPAQVGGVDVAAH
jgi:hypothetical protein